MNKKIRSGVLLLLLFVFLPKAMNAAVLTIRLYGGGTYLQGGDLNSGMKGWADYWKAYYKLQGYLQQTGSFVPVHLGFNC